MRDFRKLEIWTKGMDVVKEIYVLTKQLPDNEKFGLVSQMQRCAVSIPSNIAEGCSRNSEVEFKRFLEIAIGSAFELETQIIICNELFFLSIEETNPIINQLNTLQKQLNSLISIIAKRQPTKRKGL
jgi:four helix bundle protein